MSNHAQTQRDYHERMLRVLVYIQRHLGDDLRLEDLAETAHFSPYHFHRIFRGMVGEPLHQHVRRLRLERAALHLVHSEQPVTQIAFDAGYQTHEAFTRAFRSMFDLSPSDYRAARREVLFPSAPSGVHYQPDGRPDLQLSHPQSGGTPMNVEIEQRQPKKVAFVRHTGPYQEVGKAWEKLMQWAGPRGLCGPGMEMLGICHDDPEVTPADKLRYDACVTVGGDVKPEGEIGVQTVEGGEYAKIVHNGPYERLPETYAALCGQWLPQSGREPRNAPVFEVYVNNPFNTKPEDLVTHIYMPLKSAVAV